MSLFTPKELKVAKMKREGLMNNKIAEELRVSEADISQTLSRLSRKLTNIQNSTKLLMEIGVIREGPKYVMTEEGRGLARLPERKVSLPTECELVRVSTLALNVKGLVETSRALYVVPHDSLILGEGTSSAAPEVTCISKSVSSAKPRAILLTSQQIQSTIFSQ